MKLSVLSIAALLLNENVMAFFAPCRTHTSRGVSLLAVALTPEPEGGEEMTAVKTMPGSRMKNMGEADGVTSDQGTVYSFWMQASANAALIKDLNNQVLKDAKKKANFPGFRKGQVPPFAMRTFSSFCRWSSFVLCCALLTCGWYNSSNSRIRCARSNRPNSAISSCIIRVEDY